MLHATSRFLRVIFLLLQPSLTNGLWVALPFVGGLSPRRQGVPVLLRKARHWQQTSPQRLPGGLIFRLAQPEGSFPPVPSAWAAIRTRSSTARKSSCGITPIHPSPYDPTKLSPCKTGDRFAVIGNVSQDVQVPHTIFDISVQVAPPRLTELKNVLERRKAQALTPYNPQVWESLLIDSDLIKKYPLLPQSLRTGFLISMPNIFITQTPPNKSIIEEQRLHFEKTVCLEILKLRYIGPFSRQITESLIGPFQSSPFSIIPKPGKHDRFRLIQNYSYPHNATPIHPNTSINSFLNSDDFPTTWGTFTIVSLIIHQLPPQSQIATRDVAEAYRTIPLHHSQWPGSVVRTGEDAFCVDTVAAFGFSPSAGVYGTVADAGADIFRYKGIGPLVKWVDDHVFFRVRRQFLATYNGQCQARHTELSARGQVQQGGRLWFGGGYFPDGTLDEHVEDCRFPCLDLSAFSPRSAEDALYSYNFDDIDSISLALGIPWEKSKDRPFSTSSSYIGFNWDLETLTVSLTAEKRQKYSDSINTWLLRARHDLNDVQKLYGKLLHACLVIPAGRSYLTNLESMLIWCGPRPFTLYEPVKGLADDLSWWSLKLAVHLYRPIPFPHQLQDLRAFSDASSGSRSPSRIAGEHGASSPVGRPWTESETSDGQKPLVSSSLSSRSPGLDLLAGTLRSTAITKGLSRLGGISEVKTEPLTEFFVEFTHSSNNFITPSPSTQLMFPVKPTQQTLLPEASTLQPDSYSPRSSYQMISADSLLTLPSLTPPQKSVCSETTDTLQSLPTALTDFSRAIIPTRTIFPLPAPISSISSLTSSQFNPCFSSVFPSQDSTRIPHKYPTNLTPFLSELRPHCPARDRLCLWKPAFVRSSDNLNTEITDEDLDRLITVINTSWQPTTRETYGAGLLLFHVFCDSRLITEIHRCPADPLLMLTFISSCAGAYSGKTLANYFYAVRAWHTLHGAPWRMNAAEMKAALDGAAILAPPSSKRPKRAPLTISTITSLATKFNFSIPLDAAVFACLTTSFFSAARLGEFTLPSLKAFIPTHHVKPSDVRSNQDRNGLSVTVFRLPRTKCSSDGEDVFWAAQEGICDPQHALSNHLAVNNPPQDQPLFAWRHPSGLRALTRSEFLKSINLAAFELGLDSLKGHSIRIGAVLEYLLRGVPFDVVKSIGRWSRESFLLYLRQHAVVIAPFIQGTPIMEAFTRYTMPPPR